MAAAPTVTPKLLSYDIYAEDLGQTSTDILISVSLLESQSVDSCGPCSRGVLDPSGFPSLLCRANFVLSQGLFVVLSWLPEAPV